MSKILKKTGAGLPFAIQGIDFSSETLDGSLKEIKNSFEQISFLEEYIVGLKLETVLASLNFIYSNYSNEIRGINFGAKELGLYEDYYVLTLNVATKNSDIKPFEYEKIIFEAIPQDDQIINFLYKLEYVSFDDKNKDFFRTKLNNEIISRKNYQKIKKDLEVLNEYSTLNSNSINKKHTNKPRL